MRALRMALAIVIIVGIAGCGSPPKLMPNVVDLSLDIALTDIDRAGVKDKVEVLGGGVFGVIDKSNWQVCGQEPAAGEPVTVAPRLTVERSCDAAPGPTPTATATATQTATETPTEAATAPSEGPSEEPTEEQPATSEPEAEVLTVHNNKELAALRKLGDNCSDKIGEFAAKYSGRTIQFDGSIAAMNQLEGYKTRYDILISFGDGGTGTKGPSFQFRDVNITDELNYKGSNVPDAIGTGDNLRITAQVGDFIGNQCLLLLKPVSTEFR